MTRSTWELAQACRAGLSTLCPPRLLFVGDRRRGQSVDNPVSAVPLIDQEGGSVFMSPRGQFSMSLDTIDQEGRFSSRRGSVLIPLDRRFVRCPGSRGGFARPRRAELPTLRPLCLSFDGPFDVGARPGVSGGVTHPLPTAPFCLMGDRHRGQNVDNPVNAGPLIKRGRFSSAGTRTWSGWDPGDVSSSLRGSPVVLPSGSKSTPDYCTCQQYFAKAYLSLGRFRAVAGGLGPPEHRPNQSWLPAGCRTSGARLGVARTDTRDFETGDVQIGRHPRKWLIHASSTATVPQPVESRWARGG